MNEFTNKLSFIITRRHDGIIPLRRLHYYSSVVTGMSLLIFVAVETGANEPLSGNGLLPDFRKMFENKANR
jgi:hypothetical protein